MRRRETNFCLNTRRGRKGLKRSNVCRRRRGIFSRAPVLVMKRCERSERKLMKERHVSWSWRRSRAFAVSGRFPCGRVRGMWCGKMKKGRSVSDRLKCRKKI